MEAKTFEVTRKGDPAPGNCKPSDCSLREAVLRANARPGKDEIVLPTTKRYTLTQPNPGGMDEDVGTFGDLDINTDPLTISHPGRGKAKVDANGLDRVLHVQVDAPIALKRIVITGGETAFGAGILSQSNVRLVRSAVSGNIASEDGGGIDTNDEAGVRMFRSQLRNNASGDDGGAINGSGGAIIVRRSSIIGNQADDEGGGIRTTSDAPNVLLLRSSVIGNASGTEGGGLEVESATFLMRDSTVAGNQADSNGGGIHSSTLTEITIDSSTISGNRSIDTGSSASGGGLYLDGPTVRITNTTVAGNRADQRGGGILAQDGADLTLNAVTVVRNVAAADDMGLILIGGGGLNRTSSAGFNVRNSLIALNTVGAEETIPNDCAGDTPFDSLGNNLLSTPVEGVNCEGFNQPSDRVRANPKIGQLAKNGGPTKTVALKNGSPAIGKAHKPSSPNRDQRGRKRDNKPDIGAFERGA